MFSVSKNFKAFANSPETRLLQVYYRIHVKNLNINDSIIFTYITRRRKTLGTWLGRHKSNPYLSFLGHLQVTCYLSRRQVGNTTNVNRANIPSWYATRITMIVITTTNIRIRIELRKERPSSFILPVAHPETTTDGSPSSNPRDEAITMNVHIAHCSYRNLICLD
jgi:hypothetical protein